MSDEHTIIDVHAGDDPSPLGGAWEVDPTHSALEFVARYAMFTLVRGRFTSFSGTVVIDPPHPEATLIDVDIDASSVDTAMPVRDAQVRGELTIRGISQPVRLDVDVLGRAPDVQGNPRLGLTATAKVQRAVWGINWNAPVPGGGVALADEVTLELDVSLIPAGTASRPS